MVRWDMRVGRCPMDDGLSDGHCPMVRTDDASLWGISCIGPKGPFGRCPMSDVPMTGDARWPIRCWHVGPMCPFGGYPMVRPVGRDDGLSCVGRCPMSEGPLGVILWSFGVYLWTIRDRSSDADRRTGVLGWVGRSPMGVLCWPV